LSLREYSGKVCHLKAAIFDGARIIDFYFHHQIISWLFSCFNELSLVMDDANLWPVTAEFDF
jgi:hypothetical protein